MSSVPDVSKSIGAQKVVNEGGVVGVGGTKDGAELLSPKPKFISNSSAPVAAHVGGGGATGGGGTGGAPSACA